MIWEPWAAIQPPPWSASAHQSGTSAEGSASNGTWSRTVAIRGSPISPPCTARASRAWPGVPAELAAEEVDDAGLLGRGQHGPALGRVAGEGLLAQHVLAGGDGGQGDGRVGVGRGGDGHGVHAVEGRGPRPPR